MSLQRQRSASTGAMFVQGDEVKWIKKNGSSSCGWVVGVLTAEEKAYIFHSDGSTEEIDFKDLHLVNRYPPAARPRISIMVQSLADAELFPVPDLDEVDMPEIMKNFILGVRNEIPMTDDGFREQCRRLIDLQSVYDKIDELHGQIDELNTPDKNVIWLNQQRRDLEQTIDDLNANVSRLQADKRDLEEKVSNLEAMNQKFVGSYKQFLEQKELLVQTSQTLDGQKKELEEQLAEEKHKNNKLTEENGRNKTRIAALESQNAELERELMDTTTLYKDEITKREELQMKVASLEKNNADHLSQLELLMSANRELQQGMREWRIQNQDIFAQLKNLSSRKITSSPAQVADVMEPVSVAS